MAYERQTIRLKVDVSNPQGVVDVTGRSPFFWRSNDVQFDFLFVSKETILDVSAWNAVTLRIKPYANITADPVVSETATSFDNDVTLEDWEDGSAQHASVTLTQSESAIPAADYYFVISMLTSGSPANDVTLGAGMVSCIEDGRNGVAADPLDPDLYYTREVSDARFTTPGALAGHTARTDNPHSVTKAQVGLGDVDNTSDADKPVSTAQGQAIDLKADATYAVAIRDDVDDMAAALVTKSPIITPTFTGSISVEQSNSAPEKGKIYLGDGYLYFDGSNYYFGGGSAVVNASFLSGNGANITGLIKAQVGLALVNNTPDSGKPVSGPQQDALDLKEDLANKDVALGYPGLDADGKINPDQLPSIAVADTYVVSDETAMLALSAGVGDIAIRTDENKTYILKATPASTLSNWQELLFPTGSITSVFGRTGAVTAQSNDYTADQIEETATRVFVTPAQLAVLENTSGENTGDQTLESLGAAADADLSAYIGTTDAALEVIQDDVNSLDALLATKLPDVDVAGWQPSTTYDAFPGLVKLASGRLFLVYRNGTEHLGYGVIGSRYSDDNGKTWSAMVTLIDDVLDVRDPSITLLANGNLIMAFFKWNPSTGGSTGPWIAISTDSGINWGTASNIGTISGSIITSAVSSPAVEISAGNLVLAWYGGPDLNTYYVHVSTSSNSGSTWAEVATIDTGHQISEPNLAVTSTGGLLMTIRDETTSMIMKSTSSNGGATWTTPVDLWSGSASPRLFKTSKGNIFCFYKRALPTYIAFELQQNHFFWRISPNDGTSWGYECGGERQGLYRDYDYASACELTPGVIGVVYALHYVSGAPCKLYFKTIKDDTILPNVQAGSARFVDGNVTFDMCNIRFKDSTGYTDLIPDSGRWLVKPTNTGRDGAIFYDSTQTKWIAIGVPSTGTAYNGEGGLLALDGLCFYDSAGQSYPTARFKGGTVEFRATAFTMFGTVGQVTQSVDTGELLIKPSTTSRFGTVVYSSDLGGWIAIGAASAGTAYNQEGAVVGKDGLTFYDTYSQSYPTLRLKNSTMELRGSYSVIGTVGLVNHSVTDGQLLVKPSTTDRFGSIVYDADVDGWISFGSAKTGSYATLGAVSAKYGLVFFDNASATTPRLKIKDSLVSCVESALVTGPTLGSASGGFSLTDPTGVYGIWAGVGSTGNTWIQSQRNDSDATPYNILLNPAGGGVAINKSSASTALDVTGTITATGGNSGNWNTAYGWGNHASAGYLSSFVPAADNATTLGDATHRFSNVHAAVVRASTVLASDVGTSGSPVNVAADYMTADNIAGTTSSGVSTVKVDATGSIYFGPFASNGTWRMRVVGGNFVIELRESGTYVAKHTITP